jgi:hypothetical protein
MKCEIGREQTMRERRHLDLLLIKARGRYVVRATPRERPITMGKWLFTRSPSRPLW